MLQVSNCCNVLNILAIATKCKGHLTYETAMIASYNLYITWHHNTELWKASENASAYQWSNIFDNYTQYTPLWHKQSKLFLHPTMCYICSHVVVCVNLTFILMCLPKFDKLLCKLLTTVYADCAPQSKSLSYANDTPNHRGLYKVTNAWHFFTN